MRGPRTAVVASLAVLLAAVAAGCGAKTDVTVSELASPPAALTASPRIADTLARRADEAGERTLVDTTGRFELVVESDVAPFLGTTTATGEFDGPNRRSRLLLDQLGESADGEELEPLEVVVDGDDVFLHLPAPGQPEQWVRLPGSGAFPMPPTAGMPFGGQAWVVEALGQLGDVREAGDEELRGVSTTRYDAEGTGTVLEAPRSLSVWVDGDGFVRKVAATLDVPFAGTVTMELYDLGVPVDIQAPTDDQVLEGGDLGDLPIVGICGPTEVSREACPPSPCATATSVAGARCSES